MSLRLMTIDDDNDLLAETSAASERLGVALSADRLSRELMSEVRSLMSALEGARRHDRASNESQPGPEMEKQEALYELHGVQFDKAKVSLIRMLQMLVGDSGAVELPDGTIIGVQDGETELTQFNQLFVIKPENIVRLNA